jgi:hypothetical protein
MKVHEDKLNSAQTFEKLADIGIGILKEMSLSGKPIVEICGPVSTGGLGSVEKNINRLRGAINIANKKGLQVFNQTPFESAMSRLSDKYPKVNGYPIAILEIFYKKLFESGYITKLLFLPDWQSSKGATWERNIGPTLGLIVEEYPGEWLLEIENYK